MKYIIDQFADIKILRFFVSEFDKLNIKEKEYVYYLSEATKWGRDITWLQFNKDNIFLRKTIETIISTYKGDKNEEFEKFLVYAKRFLFSYGFYHHYGKHKFFPEISYKYFEELIDNSDMNKFLIKENQSFSEFKKWILDLIYMKEEKKGDLLLDNDTDFYENISVKEANDYYNKLIDVEDKTPISYGLNSKLIKEDNKIKEITYKKNGLYGKAIEKIIFYLDKALEVSQNEQQKEYTKLLIEYYKTGDLKTWDAYNISWVKDIDSNIDYTNGFIEVYDDPIGIKGTWEAIVDMKDYETTKITNIIANNAQWFEDNSPIDSMFKKTKVEGIKAKAIHVITLGGGCYPSSPIGINLPNADWIREKYGSKSVTITNLTDAYNKANNELPNSLKKEFIYSDEELELEKKYVDKADDIHTHLHECLGHGSGKLLDGVSSNALKEYQSTLEEARADIFSLYYMADSKLIELGITPNLDLAKAYYNSYIRGGLQTQLVRIELGKNIVEAHMQARKIIATWSYEKGKKDNIIEKKFKDNKTYFVVNDFLKLREIFKELLIELQRIKSTGDYEAGKNLVENYGVKVESKLHEETLERYKKLNLKPYSGFINPDIIFENKNYKIIYPDDFLEQNLKYGEKYSIL